MQKLMPEMKSAVPVMQKLMPEMKSTMPVMQRVVAVIKSMVPVMKKFCDRPVSQLPQALNLVIIHQKQ